MDDGLRMSVDSRTVTIYQNAGDPDYPDDEIGITMTQESFRKLIAISEVLFGVKRAVETKPTEHFDSFWRAYPKKVGKDAAKKGGAKKGGAQKSAAKTGTTTPADDTDTGPEIKRSAAKKTPAKKKKKTAAKKRAAKTL